MGKTKVKSSSNKEFITGGKKVNVKHPANQAQPRGKGLGTPGSDVGKQTCKPARPA